jgi:redox-sensitive bicupin YhaK (pirin superfamily)
MKIGADLFQKTYRGQEFVMKRDCYKDESRGLAGHGWLISGHTFSFADYYNPERMNFGLLHVRNDDIVYPSMGFSTYLHDNKEIVSILLSGSNGVSIFYH